MDAVHKFVRYLQLNPKLEEKVEMLDLHSEVGQKTLISVARGRGFRFTMDEWWAAHTPVTHDTGTWG